MSHRWLLFALTGLLGACGTDDDERPVTFEVVTLTVLAPSCGQVQCHSTSTSTEGFAFDTLEAARATMTPDASGEAILQPYELLDVLYTNGGLQRMPPDSPLADQDLALVHAWVVAGAPGL